MKFRQRIQAVLDFGESLLASQSTRLVLSVFIIVSVLPEAAQRSLFPDPLVDRLNGFFLMVFGSELALRFGLFVRSWRKRRASRAEIALLLLDVVAVVSFLPLESAVGSRYFRLIRLFRLLLLLGYWGRQARELLIILGGPERRYQVIAVVFLALVVSFCGALMVDQLAPSHDFNSDGVSDDRDRGFFRILWWSFRQVQDSGNLVAEIDRPVIVALSLGLTLVGVLVFSVIVGIGTGAIEELLERAREQPVGIGNHTVILGLTPYCIFLLEELAKIYRKNLGSFRGAVLGQAAKAPAYLRRPMLRAVRYRRGDPVRVDDLDRVNVQQAKRVLILGSDVDDPDGGVISSVLAVRERNNTVDIYPDVEHERNFAAVRAAGGPRTHIVGSGSFLGYYIAQNVVFPGIYRIHRHLLTSAGCEVYTYLFSPRERRDLTSRATFDPAVQQRSAFVDYGVSLIGLFVARDSQQELEVEDLDVFLNPAGECDLDYVMDGNRVRWPVVRGLVAVALRWEELRRFAEALMTGSMGVEEAELLPREPTMSLALHPARQQVEKVLICGDGARVPRVTFELCRSFEAIDITILTDDVGRCQKLARELESGLREVWGGIPLASQQGDGVEIRPPSAEIAARILLLAADWVDHRYLRRVGAVHLETADAVLLLPGQADSGKDEIDGRVALDCLHLANLVRGSELEPRPGLHVLGFVRDPVKGDLLERRLARLAGDGDGPRFTIVSSERARHHYLMQNVFVSGLNPVYLDLLSAAGQQIARLRPTVGEGRPPEGEMDPAEFAERLFRQRLIFLGYETDAEDGSRHIELAPRRIQRAAPIPWSEVRALYILGSGKALAAKAATRETATGRSLE